MCWNQNFTQIWGPLPGASRDRLPPVPQGDPKNVLRIVFFMCFFNFNSQQTFNSHECRKKLSFLATAKSVKKQPKNAKKRDFWPLFRDFDGPGPGSDQTRKITIFREILHTNQHNNKVVDVDERLTTLSFALILFSTTHKLYFEHQKAQNLSPLWNP